MNENENTSIDDVELLALSDINNMVLADDFVITKTAKLRASKEKTGEVDADNKPIFKFKQREFKIKINFGGKTINDLLDYASSPVVITWANGHRPLGDNWIQTNADNGKEFEVVVKDIGGEKKPKIDPIDATINEIINGKMTMEEFEAKIKKVRENNIE